MGFHLSFKLQRGSSGSFLYIKQQQQQEREHVDGIIHRIFTRLAAVDG